MLSITYTEREVMKLTNECNFNCLACKSKDCTNRSDLITQKERDFSNHLDEENLLDNSVERQIRHKYYMNNKEKHLESNNEKARKRYLNNRNHIRTQQRKYYYKNREDILNQKRRYYLDNREEILEKRKQSYTPKPKRPLKEGEKAEEKRKKELERYYRNREEINKRRREKRKEKQNEDNENK